MKLELKERDALYGATIKGNIVITMAPNSSVISCGFEGDVVLKTTGKITLRTIPMFWLNYVSGHLTYKKKALSAGLASAVGFPPPKAKIWIRENVIRNIEV